MKDPMNAHKGDFVRLTGGRYHGWSGTVLHGNGTGVKMVLHDSGWAVVRLLDWKYVLIPDDTKVLPVGKLDIIHPSAEFVEVIRRASYE